MYTVNVCNAFYIYLVKQSSIYIQLYISLTSSQCVSPPRLLTAAKPGQSPMSSSGTRHSDIFTSELSEATALESMTSNKPQSSRRGSLHPKPPQQNQERRKRGPSQRENQIGQM